MAYCDNVWMDFENIRFPDDVKRTALNSPLLALGDLRPDFDIYSKALDSIDWIGMEPIDWRHAEFGSREPRDLTSQIRKTSQHPDAHGGYGDIWKCIWYFGSGAVYVSVKALRCQVLNEDDQQKKMKRLRRELRIWKNFDHENVLPLYGVTAGFGKHIAMVSPWAENGSLNQYLNLHKDLSIEGRFRILRDVACGLCYLHSNSVTHGDLTGSNVLIYGNGQACIADFGLSNILMELQSTSSFSTSSIKGAARWAAPEMLLLQEDYDNDSSHRSTMRSDIYSFGSIMLQVLSGQIPYFHLRNDHQVIAAIVRGNFPKHSDVPHIADGHWDFIQRCWAADARSRPSSEDIVTFTDRREHWEIPSES